MMKDHPSRTVYEIVQPLLPDAMYLFFLIAKNALYLYDINNFIIINMMGSVHTGKKNISIELFILNTKLLAFPTSLILINWCTVCYDNVILNHWFYIYHGLGHFLDYKFTNQTIWFMWFYI